LSGCTHPTLARMVSGLNQRIANDFWLLRPLQVDFGLVLRRPIETAALTGQLGSESRCPAVAITIFYYIRFFEARRMFRLILLNHYKIETLAWNGPVAQRLEQRTHNPLVVGSNPTGPTTFHPRIQLVTMRLPCVPTTI
jgi:hypothetical protein